MISKLIIVLKGLIVVAKLALALLEQISKFFD